MTGDNTQQGQGDRSHDNGWQNKIAKLPNHQHIDQDQGYAKRQAHIPKSLEGDRPLASPLKAALGVGLGSTQKFTGDHMSIRGCIRLQLFIYIHHAIDGCIQKTGDLAGDILNRTQIFMIDNRVLLPFDKITKLSQRHG